MKDSNTESGRLRCGITDEVTDEVTDGVNNLEWWIWMCNWDYFNGEKHKMEPTSKTELELWQKISLKNWKQEWKL